MAGTSSRGRSPVFSHQRAHLWFWPTVGALLASSSGTTARGRNPTEHMGFSTSTQLLWNTNPGELS